MTSLKIVGYDYYKDETTNQRITVTHYSDNEKLIVVDSDHRTYPLRYVPNFAVKVGEWRAVHVTD